LTAPLGELAIASTYRCQQSELNGSIAPLSAINVSYGIFTPSQLDPNRNLLLLKALSTNMSILLVAGAWHNEQHTSQAVAALQETGFTASACHPFARQRISYEDDANFIKSEIISLVKERQDVCIIIHSLAARAACEAVTQLLAEDSSMETTLKHLIWIGAFLTTNVEDIPSLTNGDVPMDMETQIAPVKDAAHLFFNDSEPAEAQRLANSLEPTLQLYPPLELSSEKYKAVPMTYLRCANDNMVPYTLQTREATANNMAVLDMSAGHSVFATQPRPFAGKVANILRDL
jgi:hypothetical protein